MNSEIQRTRSVWMPHLPEQAPGLINDVRADVAVVGAGIAGLTTAYLLACDGRTVVVLDAGRPGGGMTSRTTAHLASALDDRWADLVARHGAKEASLAAEAHVGAIDFIDRVRSEEGIDCDFARIDGFLFSGPGCDPKILKREIEAAELVGLKDITWAAHAPVAIDTGTCVTFPRQGRFHPLKYVQGLIRCIEHTGGRLFTARALSIKDGDPVRIETLAGHIVEAAAAVVATNSPINDRVAIHTKQAPYRSYVVAGRVPKGTVQDALYWDTLDPYHYARLQPLDDADDMIIVGGEDHKSGQEHDMEDRLERLETWTRQYFPQVRSFDHRWSGQVMEPVDYLGYLGRNPGDDRVYIVTGDSGMGMTHGTIGGLVISDLIAGRHNRWAELFDPARKTAGALGDFARENLNVAAQFADYLTGGDVSSPEEIRPGSGAVIRRGAQKIAAYRDIKGALYEQSAVCTHLGCIVAWNPLEGCWDCPCHGSQFGPDGEPINGPAVKPLAPISSQQEENGRRSRSDVAR